MPKCNALQNLCYTDIDLHHGPCCKFNGKLSPVFNIKDVTFSDYKNSKFFKELKEQMETGWAPGCHQCEDDEKNGIASLRETYNKTFSGNQNDVECIEISFSNECNLTCKMCDSRHSSKWASVYEKNPIEELKFDGQVAKQNSLKIADLFDGVDLSKLKQIKYMGGETFITQEIYDLIDFLEEKDICQHISFKSYTNATFFPKKLIDKLKKFKTLELGLSIDAINDTFDFIRPGFEWKRVLPVIDQWIEARDQFSNFKIYIHHTAQAYNLHHFDEVKDFAKTKNLYFHYSILHYPEYLSYSALPKEYIQELVDNDKLTDEKLISSALGSTFNKDWFEKLKIITKKTDQVLNTDVNKVIPDLAKHLR
jgi:MoaA/NifB/PqqE/SkfB family radical SAM enzyme